MHPILLHLGDTAIHSYGAAGALGFLLVCAVAMARGRSEGIPRERIADVIFWTALVALAGSRILFLIQNPGHADTLWEAVNLRAGGLVFYGAMIAGLPAASLLILKYELPFFRTWDVFASALPLGHAVSRVGCLLAGCCYGLPADVPWAVTFPPAQAIAPVGVPLHPTQAYEALLLFGIFGVCNALWRYRRADGQITLAYLVMYAIGRSIIEEFRGDADRGFLLGGVLSTSQALSLVIAAVALVLFFAVPRWLGTKALPPASG